MYRKTVDHTQQFKREKARLGVLFGFLAGLVFVFFLWGLDAITLARANTLFPWAKLLMGILPTLLVCSLAGWLSAKLESALYSALIWLVTGVLLCVFACHLPFDGLSQYYRWFAPQLSDRAALPFNSGLSTRAFIVLLICAAISFIGGIFYKMLLDNSYNAASKIGGLFPLIIWLAIFVCLASPIDYMIQRPMRDPIVAINNMVPKKISSMTTPVSTDEARSLAALGGLEDIIQSPRQLMVAKYDTALGMIHVGVDFGGKWVDCSVFLNSSSEPPVPIPIFCNKLK